VDSVQGAVGSGQWAVGSGQCAVWKVQCAAGSGLQNGWLVVLVVVWTRVRCVRLTCMRVGCGWGAQKDAAAIWMRFLQKHTKQSPSARLRIFARESFPSNTIGSSTFSRADIDDIKLNVWKQNPLKETKRWSFHWRTSPFCTHPPHPELTELNPWNFGHVFAWSGPSKKRQFFRAKKTALSF
jgi:hypothetical protein